MGRTLGLSAQSSAGNSFKQTHARSKGCGDPGDRTLGAVLFFTGLDPQRSPVWRYSLDKRCPLSSYLNGTFPNISLGIFF